MDLVIRYWNDDTGKVAVRYLGSEFLGHGRAVDLLDKFNEGLKHLNPKCLLQVSMDGPKVNWKFLDDLMKERQKEDPSLPEILNLGSCGLHVVHGCLQHGASKTDWDVGQILRSMWQIFHDTPARREDFTRVTGSTIFQHKFCSHRWVEDFPVAVHAIKMWPNIVKFIDSYANQPKSKVPTSASFLRVKAARDDPLTIAKLEFFCRVGKAPAAIPEKVSDRYTYGAFSGRGT